MIWFELTFHKATSVQSTLQTAVLLQKMLWYCGRIKGCQKAGCYIGRTWQGWEGRAQGHVLVESLLVLCVCLEAISNRSSKDSSCAHKGLATNWLHHRIFRDADRLH